jgi:hypothetical protein
MILVRTVYPPIWLPSTITTPNTTTARIAYHTIPISTIHCQWRPIRLLYYHDQGRHSLLATKTVNPRSKSRKTLLVNDKDAFSSLSSYIVLAHVGPVYSGGQTQVALPDTPSHVPLLWQGSESHGSGIASELKWIPLKTYINWEWYAFILISLSLLFWDLIIHSFHDHVCLSCDHCHDYPSSGHGHHYLAYYHGHVCLSHEHGHVCLSYYHGQDYFYFDHDYDYISYDLDH